MILNAAVIAALVLLLKALAEQFLPMFPISSELINAIVVALLGWLGFEGLKLAAERLAAKSMNALKTRGLIK